MKLEDLTLPEDFSFGEFVLSHATNLFHTPYVPSNTLGVKFHSQRQVWQAFFTFKCKEVVIGEFDSKQKAVIARYRAEIFSSDPYFDTHSSPAIYLKAIVDSALLVE